MAIDRLQYRINGNRGLERDGVGQEAWGGVGVRGGGGVENNTLASGCFGGCGSWVVGGYRSW